MDLAGISFTDERGQIFLHNTPQEGRPPVDLAALHDGLAQAGYGQCAINETALARALDDCNTVQSPFMVQIGERRNSAVQVQIAPDDMSAQISIAPPQGGQGASPEDVIFALQQAGVVFGIDHAAVAQACAADPGPLLVVAYAQTPVNGVDAIFEELIPQSADRAPKLDANGMIDYREHSGIALVEPNAPLMRRKPPTPGLTGHTVRGRVLEPRPGRDTPFAANMSGTKLADEDPNLLKAEITGQPVRVPNGVTVEPVLRVAEVNMDSGNIHFNGSVQIDGEVTQGMKVHASGDIVVKGTVDGATLQAGGSILISGGVIAQARCEASGSISARFAENSHLISGTVISLDDMALGCQLQALNQILIGVKAPQRGRLVGGSAKTMMLLKVPFLGSDKSGTTHVLVGANPDLEQQYQDLLLRLEKEKANEENLQKIVKHLGAIGDPKGMLERAKAAWHQAVQVWGKSLAERTELEEQLALTQDARLEVTAGTAGVVELAFGTRKFRLVNEYDAGIFSVDAQAQLVFTDRTGQASIVG